MVERKETPKPGGNRGDKGSVSIKETLLEQLKIDLAQSLISSSGASGKAELQDFPDLFNVEPEREPAELELERDPSEETSSLLLCREWLSDAAFIARCISCDLNGRKIIDALHDEGGNSQGFCRPSLRDSHGTGHKSRGPLHPYHGKPLAWYSLGTLIGISEVSVWIRSHVLISRIG
jgi:hypothetical protein